MAVHYLRGKTAYYQLITMKTKLFFDAILIGFVALSTENQNVRRKFDSL